MKWLWSVIITLVSAIPAYAGSPELEFSKKEIDLGAFDGDSLQTASVSVRNIGSDTLIIYRVHTSCRCTRPKNYDKIIAPGDSTVIIFTYDGRGHSPGRIHQTLSFRTNSRTSYNVCHIVGEIRRPLQK